MTDENNKANISRRQMLGSVGKVAAAAAVLPMLQTRILSAATTEEALPALNGIAGVDRVAMITGKTYLRGWAGYGEPPRPGGRNGGGRGANAAPTTPPETGPTPTVTWKKVSGPGNVTFADPKALQTTATFSKPGNYVLGLAADNGSTKAESTLNVKVENPPPTRALNAVYTKNFKVDSPLWNERTKALVVGWIPHCIDTINDTTNPAGGIDNFIEAGKALRGEPHGVHKGYVFSNAWVHQTVESMSIALMMDPKGDPDILKAHQKFRDTLDQWIPIILAAQEKDGYMQTAFTLPRPAGRGSAGANNPTVAGSAASAAPAAPQVPFEHWTRRGDHEGYTAGYFLESAINHYLMTDKKDARMYNAAKRLADCWYANLGPAPKKEWYDGHEEMEQALVRFGRFVNDMEGGGKGDHYIQLAKFLLDCRYNASKVDPNGRSERSEYDQSHLPVIEQYEAVGHAVRAAYCYSGMADVAVETHNPDYQSAVKSLWDNITNKKYYVTGGIGSGETSEGFGPNYSLRNTNAYCESCSTCGQIFFQWKLNLAYHDAKYADLYEESTYNALLGSTDLPGHNYYYPNPLDAPSKRVPWATVACCVGNIPRTLLMFPTWLYAKSDDGVYVNMYAGSTITVENVGGTDVEMVQQTNYPWQGAVAITVNPAKAKQFTVRLRVPNREVSELYTLTPKVGGLTKLAVNGKSVSQKIENGYAVITRNWKPGDKIELEIPLAVQVVRATDKIEADRGRVALRWGPVIYNVEAVDQDINKQVDLKAPLTTEWKPDLLGGVLVIHGKFKDGSPMLAIPNYARMNREPELPPRTEISANGIPTGGGRGQPRPIRSAVWIKETAV